MPHPINSREGKGSTFRKILRVREQTMNECRKKRSRRAAIPGKKTEKDKKRQPALAFAAVVLYNDKGTAYRRTDAKKEGKT
ncbi:MAG: hypothetical protein IKX85_06635 [Clostridia bacterium]|nr:hypothetical protein [Clostridia bacterium]